MDGAAQEEPPAAVTVSYPTVCTVTCSALNYGDQMTLTQTICIPLKR